MANSLPFRKMHGLANDYVVVDGADVPDDLALDALARKLCDRRRGVGADGLLVLTADPGLQMRIFNCDGSEAEMCGNGLRCAVRDWQRREQLPAASAELRVQTGAGVLPCRVVDEEIECELGGARAPLETITLAPGREAVRVDMGNPHLVVFVEAGELDELDLPTLGPPLERTHGANIEWVECSSASRLRQRTWERGVGETPACGTGAAAVLLAALATGRANEVVTIELRGGELHLRTDGVGDERRVVQRGQAVHVFEGAWPLP